MTRTPSRRALVWLGALSVIAACGTTAAAAAPDSVFRLGAVSPWFARNGADERHAMAVLLDSAGRRIGDARLKEDATGVVHVRVRVKGISPGQHAIHLHAVGACSGDGFAGAGGHFNPLAMRHGLDNPGGPHAGDLPNLTIDNAGEGRMESTTYRVTLGAGTSSLFDADGSALVIHARPDDQKTDPSGNSGARIACGVITRVRR